MIILVMGLPGAGKTTLADTLAPLLHAKRLNADEVRKAANDWDFSTEGRQRQAARMAEQAKALCADGSHVIADFVCPTPEARALFPHNYLIWVNTIRAGRFEDTNKVFMAPAQADFRVHTQNAERWAAEIAADILHIAASASTNPSSHGRIAT
jgi:adenylylsulfate kinase